MAWVESGQLYAKASERKNGKIMRAFLTVRQAPSLKKMEGISSIVRTKQVTHFVSFQNIPGKQQHFNVTNGKFVYFFRWESILFRTKLA